MKTLACRYRSALAAFSTVLVLSCASDPQDAGDAASDDASAAAGKATEAPEAPEGVDADVRAEAIGAEIDAGAIGEWQIGHVAEEHFDRVAIADLNAAPADFADRKVVVSGTVARVCQTRGCWVEVADAEGASMMASSFDHGVLLPKNCAEMAIEIVGTMYADPVEEGEEQTYTFSLDGAHLERGDDG